MSYLWWEESEEEYEARMRGEEREARYRAEQELREAELAAKHDAWLEERYEEYLREEYAKDELEARRDTNRQQEYEDCLREDLRDEW